MRLSTFLVGALLMLTGCGEEAERKPTDEELSRFTNRLEADAERDSEAAIARSRHDEADRASAAEVRLKNSARERREQARQ